MADQIGKLLELGLYAGRLLLENGAEIYRVEDTIHRMLMASGADEVSVIVTPTAIHLSVCKDEARGSQVRRIHQRSTNLARVSAINNLSRSLRPRARSPESITAELSQIERDVTAYAPSLQIFAAGIGGMAFAALFGATGWELPAAALAGLAVQIGVQLLGRVAWPRLLQDFAGGFLAALTAVVLSQLVPTIDYNRVIVGAIISLVPGVLLTTGVRDMLAGDLLSGTIRMSEALFVAAAIAAGVAVVLGWWVR